MRISVCLSIAVAFGTFIPGNHSKKVHKMALTKHECGFPTDLPGIPSDNSKAAGIWYEYLVHTPGTVDANGINTYTPIGDYSSLEVPVEMEVIGRYYPVESLKDNDPKCSGIYHVANFSSDGQRVGLTWFPGASSPVPTVYTLLYIEYDFVEIRYTCGSPPDQNLNGMCANPFYFTCARKRPTELSPEELDRLTSLTNMVLEPYCTSTANMTHTTWDDSQPDCEPTPPESFVAFLDLTRQKHKRPNVAAHRQSRMGY